MRLARNSLYSLAGLALPVLVSLATIPFFIAQIGAERYGALAIAWLVLGYFGMADFGIGRAITQRIAALGDSARPAKADAVWSALLTIAGFGLLTAGILFVSARWYFAGPFKLDEALRIEAVAAVWVLALCSPAVAINGVLAGALMGLERFRLVAISNTIANSGLLLLPLAIAYFLSTDLKWLIAGALLARLIGTAMLGAGVWNAFLKGQAARFSRVEFGHLANFGGWIMVSSLVGPIMLFADRFLIGILIDAVAVAAYAIPFQVAFRTLLLPIAISQALFPRFVADEEENSRLRCRQFAAFVGQIFAPIVIILICMAKPLLSAWLGSALDPRSIVIGQIVLLGIWANAIALIPFGYLQARGLPRYTAMLHMAELPFYLLMLWVLGIAHGLAGMAAAFSLRCAIDCFALLSRARVSDLAIARQLALPAILITVALAAGTMLDDWILQFAIAVMLVGVAVIALLKQMPPTLRSGFMKLPWAGSVFAPIWRDSGQNSPPAI